jgi:putative spermidine/putrescine transport system permease protein
VRITLSRRSGLFLLGALGFGFVALPMLVLWIASGSTAWRWPEVWPTAWGGRAWAYVFAGPSDTWGALLTGLGIAVAVTVMNLAIAWPAAEALARRTVPGKRWIEALLYAPIIVPGFVSLMGLHALFIRYGLADSVVGVIAVTLPLTLPYMLHPLTIGYATLGTLWEDQGRMLGAGRYARLRWIVLPTLAPSIAIGCGFSLIVAFSQYLIPLIMGGGRVQTLPMVMVPFLSGGDMAIGAAYAILFSAVAAGLLWLSGATVRYVTSPVPTVPHRRWP